MYLPVRLNRNTKQALICSQDVRFRVAPLRSLQCKADRTTTLCACVRGSDIGLMGVLDKSSYASPAHPHEDAAQADAIGEAEAVPYDNVECQV